MKIIFYSIFFFCATSLSGYAQYTKIDPSGTIVFFIKNAGIEVEGKVDNPTGTCNIDTKEWENSKMQLEFKPGSINTGIKMRDDHLKKADYFDIKKFPSIRLTASGFQIKSSSEGILDATIEIKGKIKKITIPFSYIVQNDLLTIRAKTTLNRLDFGVGSSSFILSDEVTVQILFIVRR